MDSFETGETPALAVTERKVFDQEAIQIGLPSSYVPGENDSWDMSTPLNEMRAGGILLSFRPS